MKSKDLLLVLCRVSNGEKCFREGAIGSNGYGFLFSNYLELQNPEPGDSSFCLFNLYRESGRKWDKKSLIEEQKNDIYVAGCVKTLVPTLEFGGDELLFESWVLIRTPNGKLFPAIFYYGQSGLALGGWRSYRDNFGNALFSRNIDSIINFSPFDFNDEDLKPLVSALEGALKIVPPSDFYGVYKHDLGHALMGVKYGRPFCVEIDPQMTNDEIRDLYYFLLV
ncbi:MAG: hypothetical protein ACFFBI_06000 [Promethearchaeota archaeon]